MAKRIAENLYNGKVVKMDIIIKQAGIIDIPIIESILFNAANWLDEMNQPLWNVNNLKWESLSKHFQINNFYIAYLNDEPAGCMAIIDDDPFFWGSIPKGESLFVHKLAVKKSAKKSGVSNALINYFKEKGKEAQVKSLRLDTHALCPKLRAFYENQGFVCVEEKILNEKYHTAFYVFTL
jgi:N-acetylglutamate synthase-like GNAT family acetyltransferase